MIQRYYPVDFEAQYEETSEKMIEISKRYKDIILNQNPSSVETIEEELVSTQTLIEEFDLQFRKEPIYSEFASGQLMAERRKNPPEMCPECGDELKKFFQCEFCAELFCKKCCYRMRVIPFVSKQAHQCCEQCHFKFVKLLDNKDFYEEKQKLVNVLNFTRNKMTKVYEKIEAKKKEVEEIKSERRNDRIKDKNMAKKILDEQKKLRQLEEEFKRVIAAKAEKIKELDKKKQRQLQQQRERALTRQSQEAERKIAEEKQKQNAKRQEENRRRQIEEANKRKQQLQKNDYINKEVVQQQLSSQAAQNLIQKQKAEQEMKKQAEIKRRYDEQMRKKQLEIEQLKKMLQQQSAEKKKARKPSINSQQSKKQSDSMDTPKQTMVSIEAKDGLINTATTEPKKDRSRKESSEISGKSSKNDKEKKHVTMEPPILKSEASIKGDKSEKKEIPLQKKQSIDEPVDSLERTLSRMLRVSKEDDSKSVVSNLSKSIIDMSVNQLLSLRIPVAGSKKIEDEIRDEPQEEPEDKQSSAIDDPIEPVSPLSSRGSPVDRGSIKIENINVPTVSEEDMMRDRNQIIRNSSLISSTRKDEYGPESIQVDGKKCQCLIM